MSTLMAKAPPKPTPVPVPLLAAKAAPPAREMVPVLLVASTVRVEPSSVMSPVLSMYARASSSAQFTATEADTPTPLLFCDVLPAVSETPSAAVAMSLLAVNLPPSLASLSTLPQADCQEERSLLLWAEPSEPCVPPVPGLKEPPPWASEEPWPLATPADTTRLAATPPFPAPTRTFPPEVTEPRVPEAVSEARSPMTAWVSRTTMFMPTLAPTPTPSPTATPPRTLKSQALSVAVTKMEPLSSAAVEAGSRMCPEPTSMTAPFSIWAVVELRTTLTPTVPLRPKFCDEPPEAPTLRPKTVFSAATVRVSAPRTTPSSILAVTLPA
ncbi:hypothetical protein DSECCO2_584630 [anaerobic digester metagenome]